MLRRGVLSLFAAALVAGTATSAAAAYPERPITLLVPWGAGGGTDATARIVGSILERELGVPVNVVNRTGGSGVVGHSAIATAPADGYTIGMLTVEIGMMHWQGLTELTGASYTPLALMNEDPPGVNVSADSEYQTLGDLVAAIKEGDAGDFTASGTGQGGIWHVALGGMLQAAGLPADHVQWVPSQGAAPGLQDLVAGGVDLVTCSVPEAKSLIDAGKVKSLAIMAPARNPLFPDVPTLKEGAGVDFTVGAWRGIAGPKGMPQEAVDRLAPLLERIATMPEFTGFMNQRGFGITYANPDQFASFMAERDTEFGEIMKGLGLAR